MDVANYDFFELLTLAMLHDLGVGSSARDEIADLGTTTASPSTSRLVGATEDLWEQVSHRSSVLCILEKYAIRAGIETPSPHQLRHTFATRYLRANPGDLRGLARLLGHANLNTVMIYTEPDMDDLAERIERIEAEG